MNITAYTTIHPSGRIIAYDSDAEQLVEVRYLEETDIPLDISCVNHLLYQIIEGESD